MLAKENFFQKNGMYFLIGTITLVALIMRVKCCFWGSPMQLHTDESAIVDWTIEMLERHSWEAHFYDRPDHFEMKCNAVFFSIVSWVKYHKPAYEAFTEHKMTFYILARLYTTMFGTALVPLISVFAGKLVKTMEQKYRRIVQLCAAVLVAFPSIFVQHSALATPDIVLTFFVVLFACRMIDYLENGNRKYLYLCTIITGVGITIKYPAAILCLLLAGMVIYRACLVEKQPKNIIKYGFLCAGIVFFVIFVIAPNLITDISTVCTNIIEEARPTHLGSDGLGFVGNMIYYIKAITSKIGLITSLLFVSGLIYMFIHRSSRWLSLSVGLIYWICISSLSLHWLRWGFPIYPFYMVVTAVGAGGIFCAIDKYLKIKKVWYYVGKSAVKVCMGFIMLSTILSGFCMVKYCSLPDTRALALEYMEQNGITEKDSYYEGYTPFALSDPYSRVNGFTKTKDGVKVKIVHGAKQYFIMSDFFKKRYLEEPERYPDECAIYNSLGDSYKKIYEKRADGNYETSSVVLKNIVNSWKYLRGNQTSSGNTITIYDLNPTVLTLQNLSGNYLSAVNDEQGIYIQTSEEPYQWILYEDEGGSDTLLSSYSGLALDFDGADLHNGTKLELREATGETAQQWTIERDGKWSYLVNNENKALTYGEEGIYLSDYTKVDNQRWIIEKK